MNTLTSLCLAVGLVCGTLAEDSYNTGPGSSAYGSSNSAYGSGSSAYGSGSSAYGTNFGGNYGPRRGSYPTNGGYGRSQFGFPPFPSYGKQPLNELDQVYAELETLLSQIKTYTEQMEALVARQAVHKTTMDELLRVQLPGLAEVDERQNEALNSLAQQLAQTTTDADALQAALVTVHGMNNANSQNQEEASVMAAAQQLADTIQGRSITTMLAEAQLLSAKLDKVNANEFALVNDRLESATGRLASIQARENRRHCESGKVTLDGDDRRVQYQYQKVFRDVPQVIWGICGFNLNLDNEKDSSAPYLGGYNRYEPEGLGTTINVYSTRVGMAVEKFDKSFGDTKSVTTDVCFQACTIDPGTGPLVN